MVPRAGGPGSGLLLGAVRAGDEGRVRSLLSDPGCRLGAVDPVCVSPGKVTPFPQQKLHRRFHSSAPEQCLVFAPTPIAPHLRHQTRQAPFVPDIWCRCSSAAFCRSLSISASHQSVSLSLSFCHLNDCLHIHSSLATPSCTWPYNKVIAA